MKIAGCGCPEQVVSLKDSSVVFEGLNQQEEYFPMISTVSPQSFYGLPPAAIRPAVRADSPPAPRIPLVMEARPWATKHEQDGHNDLYDDIYDASSAGGDFDDQDMEIDTDTPAMSPLESSSFGGTGSHPIHSSPIPIRVPVGVVLFHIQLLSRQPLTNF